jgi:hypothetical protein
MQKVPTPQAPLPAWVRLAFKNDNMHKSHNSFYSRIDVFCAFFTSTLFTTANEGVCCVDL